MGKTPLEKDIEMGKSNFRGHDIEWDEQLGHWRYSDDKSVLPANGGECRSCKRCGETWEIEGGDKCLGILPGVNNACCGHGVRSRSYVRFDNGVTIRGFIVDEDEG
jgi:hypothetical protein